TVATSTAADKYLRATLTAPMKPGRYEIRYLARGHEQPPASRPLTVTPANIRLEAPQQVTASRPFAVRWSGSINSWDRITIVPADAGEGTIIHNLRVKDDRSGRLIAPDRTGDFE